MSSINYIDSHCHVWKVERGDYDWLNESMTSLYKDFSIDDYKEAATKFGVTGCVLVQAAPTVDETSYLLNIAMQSGGFVKGVVGWCDMLGGDTTITNLKQMYDSTFLNGKPLLVGIRPMLENISQEDWMLQKELAPVINWMISKNIVFEALVRPGHLKHLRKFLIRYPRLKVVIDHAAKPSINGDKAAFDQWKADIEWIAKNSQTSLVKISGFYNQVTVEAGKEKDITEYNSRVAPYVMHLVRWFTPKRLMWGSDWPVHDNYEAWFKFCRDCFSTLSKEQQTDFFQGNATRLYGF
ncbi:hypothetical protein SAMD00019534_044870, partial [Acytostelium subglobosum LB1]|uniref:hypothetical protein n=1 Tax=Acytostelium subglobosum LB1 TaxID=1410327 RepID=UPI000644D9FB